MLVKNSSGTMIDFETSINYMDDKIRELIHKMGDYENEQEFFSMYEFAHVALKHENWELSKPNPVY